MKERYGERRGRPAFVLVAVLGGFVSVLNVTRAQPWAAGTVTPQTHQSWTAVACSADGMKVAAGGMYPPPDPGFGLRQFFYRTAQIYASTDAGATWVPTRAPTNLWQAIASSADGSKLIAAASIQIQSGFLTSFHVLNPSLDGDGLVYTSSDSGATWNPVNLPNNTWSCVASSADGTRLVAGATLTPGGVEGLLFSGDGSIYRSSDSGVNWGIASAPSGQWRSLASSADGTKLFAADGGTNAAVYRSLDSGATWERTSSPPWGWTSIACSVDGTRLLAVASTDLTGTLGTGRIYVSTDSGNSWSQTLAPPQDWSSIAASADATKLVAVGASGWSHGQFYEGDGQIYTSMDGGTTWVATQAPSAQAWEAVACSADGFRVVAGSSDGWLSTLPYAGPWKATLAPAGRWWWSVAAAADAAKLVAADSFTSIYTSRDFGTTWSQTTAPSNAWASVACSSDGTKVAAAAREAALGGDGAIYVSTNSGANWSKAIGTDAGWVSVACSADGAQLAAVPPVGSFYISRDFGAHWAVIGPNRLWSCIASSGSGLVLVASTAADFSANPPEGHGLIYVSTNAGATWSPTKAPTNAWTSVTSSVDGTKLAAAADLQGNGFIYASSDSGASWSRTTAPSLSWTSLASSADGATLAAVAAPFVYISTNSGATWTQANAPAGAWQTVAVSSKGADLLVAGRDGMQTLHQPGAIPPSPPSPSLSMARSGPGLVLSWLVPSTPFVLQQSSDLAGNGWQGVSAAAILNPANLHNEVTLPSPSDNAFYRLKQQ
jgi:hypothetical protein